jgi:ribosomal protein S18 acetylase RimI-like enzyme
MIKPIIERATLKDLPVISELMYKQAQEERKFMNHLDKKEKFSFYSAPEIRKELSSPQCCILLVKIGDKIGGCGMAKIEKASHWSKYKKQGYLGMLYVEKEYRRQGIAKVLQSKRIAWLKSKGISLISCGVLSNNIPALKLAEKIGFKHHLIYMYKELS